MKKFSGDMGPVLFEPWATLHRRCDGYPVLQQVVMWLGRRLQPRQIEMDAGRFVEDPFASVWDAASLERMRALLRRVAVVSEAEAVPLYLYWGTLLGHVREGGILAWDDDVDLAVFEPERVQALQAALEAAGLQVELFRSRTDSMLKVFDPASPRVMGASWGYPFIDIFTFAPAGGGVDAPRFPMEMQVPGRPVSFEGARLWEPEQPLAILDQHYRGWRTIEKSAGWNHREERGLRIIAVRTIRTDTSGRKLS